MLRVPTEFNSELCFRSRFTGLRFARHFRRPSSLAADGPWYHRSEVRIKSHREGEKTGLSQRVRRHCAANAERDRIPGGQFPDGFKWSCATASYQIEGAWEQDRLHLRFRSFRSIWSNQVEII